MSLKKKYFNEDIAEFLMEINIPFKKVEHLTFRRFFKKWTGQNVIDRTTYLRDILNHYF